MKSYGAILSSVLFLFLAGCSGNDDEPQRSSDFATFIKETEWVGVLDRIGYEYPLPFSLKFKSDNTFTMYAPFIFYEGSSEIQKDSISGTISSIDSLADGRTRINTSLNTTFRQVTTTAIYINARKDIMGIASDPNEPPTFQGSIFPKGARSINGVWTGPPKTPGGHDFTYPDLSEIIFSEKGNTTTYIRDGQTVLASAPNVILFSSYVQKGARVYMSGYDETYDGGWGLLINYYGVLTPTGDKMMVHSRSGKARLPHYTNTNEPYGPNGRYSNDSERLAGRLVKINPVIDYRDLNGWVMLS